MAEKKTQAASTTAKDADDETPEPEQIKAEIEETREDLGDTVAALADKADVKKQAKQKAEQVKGQAQQTASAAAEKASQAVGAAPETATQAANRVLAGVRENPMPAVGAGVGLLVLVALIRRRR